ncbi:MAG: ATP-binding protein [Elusimicrobiota bacterium]|jgi:predicted ATP-dependent endonuclease of OLD family|nr:ATP-binding protein [Elusimicrobiota bacterium]
MELYIEKFGKIKKADIKTRGLTLIAGKNDSGKSTVGKVLFAMIKSVGNWKTLYDEEFIQNISYSDFVPLLTQIQRNITIDDKFDKYINDVIADFQFLLHPITKNAFIEYIKTIQKQDKIKNNTDIYDKIEKINLLVSKKVNDSYKMEYAFSKYFTAEFRGNLINSINREDKFIINYKVRDNKFVEITGDKKVLNSDGFNIDLENSFFRKVFMIDTPLYLGTSNFAFCNEFHQRELMKEINNAVKQIENNNFNENIVADITRILNGASFVYNKNNRKIEYKVSENAYPLSTGNIASGAKAFGSLLILLKAGVLSKEDSFLILDEPENHLHPQWQIDYAESIVKLVKEGFYVLSTSHSPEFIHALKYYCQKYGIWNDKANFYLSQQIQNENYCEIIDVTKDTNRIFSDLVSPSSKLFMDFK